MVRLRDGEEGVSPEGTPTLVLGVMVQTFIASAIRCSNTHCARQDSAQ